MKFTKLRLLGFKSFVEPSEFVIERGLTGVVGPNGCGKSNLVEALMLAKYLERVGDHAQNIAEGVEYALTGRYKGEVLG